MAALSLRHSKTALGAYYRHTAVRKGGDVAVFATARKLATLIYRLRRWGQPYLDEGAVAYEKRYQEGRIKRWLPAQKISAIGLRHRLLRPEHPSLGEGSHRPEVRMARVSGCWVRGAQGVLNRFGELTRSLTLAAH